MRNFYNSDLVDIANVIASTYYHDSKFESDIELIKTCLNRDLGLDGVYKIFLDRLSFMFLHGISHAVDNEVDSYHPTDTFISDFHKNRDFAFIFNFGDNDFGCHFERAAELYCKIYNDTMYQIDIHERDGFVNDEIKSLYYDDITKLESIDKIKELLKIGVASADLLYDVNTLQLDKVSWQNSKNNMVRTIDEYIPWDATKATYVLVDNKWVVTGDFPRFVVGTKAEIENSLKDYGTPDKEPKRKFPVWCNGEVLIVYMKNNRLVYTIR